MAEWYPDPKYPDYSGTTNATYTGAAKLATPQEPTLELPKEGDTIKLAVHKYGGVEVIAPHTQLVAGSTVVEVSVTGIKTAKIVLE